MALLKVKKSDGFAAPAEGWHEVTIVSADRGRYQTGKMTKYLDIRFSEFPEQVKLRVHQVITDGEEWKILSIFRYANAGITELLVAEDGEGQINIDDDPRHLVGCKLNVYVYKKDNGYTEVSDNVAPSIFSNDYESYDEKGVEDKKKVKEAQIKTFINKNTSNDDWDSSNSNDNGVPETMASDGWD